MGESTQRRHSRRNALRLGGAAGVAVAAGATAPYAGVRAQDGTPTTDGGATGVTKQTVPLETAMALIEAAQAAAAELGVPVAVAVVDESGLLKAFARMDRVNSAATVDIVQMKAYSSASFRAPTHRLAEGVADNGPRAASLANVPGFTLLAGGVPIEDGETVVGGLGVGGGSPDQDVEIAEAALAALAES